MDPIDRNVLHRIKRVNEVEDLGELNDYLELGWILLNIRISKMATHTTS